MGERCSSERLKYIADNGLRRMPDNHQIDKVMEYSIAASPIDLHKLSPEGRELIEDSRSVQLCVLFRSDAL